METYRERLTFQENLEYKVLQKLPLTDDEAFLVSAVTTNPLLNPHGLLRFSDILRAKHYEGFELIGGEEFARNRCLERGIEVWVPLHDVEHTSRLSLPMPEFMTANDKSFHFNCHEEVQCDETEFRVVSTTGIYVPKENMRVRYVEKENVMDTQPYVDQTTQTIGSSPLTTQEYEEDELLVMDLAQSNSSVASHDVHANAILRSEYPIPVVVFDSDIGSPPDCSSLGYDDSVREGESFLAVNPRVGCSQENTSKLPRFDRRVVDSTAPLAQHAQDYSETYSRKRYRDLTNSY